LADAGSWHVPGTPPFAPPFVYLVETDALLASGILGGLSPQLLAPVGRSTVLDFVQGKLSIARSVASPRPATRGRLWRAGSDPRDGFRYVVPVRVDGHSAMLLVDSGAESTTIYERSPLAEPLLRGRRTETVRVAGAASVVEMRLLEGVPIEFGGARTDGRLTVGPGHGQCGEDGLLGFDALRRCRLAMNDEGIHIACLEGEVPLHRAPPLPAPEPVVLTRIAADAACGRSGRELAPVPDSALPFAFDSAIAAYAVLSREVRVHA